MVQVMAVMLSDLTRSVNCLNCRMETRTIEPFSTTKVPKAMTVFKKISFDAASIPVSGKVW